MKPIVKNILSLPYRLYSRLYYIPIIIHNFICRRRQLLPTYRQLAAGKPVGSDGGKTVILMVRNDTTFSGGLSDRLRGIVSVYDECKRQGLKFKVYFETPQLADYLESNQYDWRIEEDQICYDAERVYPCTILTYHRIEDRRQPKVQKRILRWYLKKNYEQIHVYTNMYSGDENYGTLFRELFKPTPDLKEQADYHVAQLGGVKQYSAIVFRFRQLLGDFREGGEILPENEREAYIQRCMSVIEKQHQTSENEKILVTSDSTMFLNRLSILPYVYVIPGDVVHMGFTYDASKKTYMKSFVDYFVLSNAKKVTLVRDDKMYHSGFALRAAMLNKAEYKETWM